jgi:Domain of unknown function (DUF6948)
MVNLDDLTIGEAKRIASCFGAEKRPAVDNEMIGCYVIVRCHDAGVHAGRLAAYNGREAVLDEARRLWYWKPANKAKFLSGVAVYGLHDDSKIGEPIHVHLTETCEIIRCSVQAEKSISKMRSDADE